MHTVAVVGPHSSELTERLVGELSDGHAIATISDLPVAPAPGFEDAIGYTAEGAGVSIGFSSEGWTAHATHDPSRDQGHAHTSHDHDRSIPDMLDDLAPEYDYCLLDGFDNARLPTIAVQDQEEAHAGETIATVAEPTSDLDGLISAIDATEPHETLESLVARVKRSPRADRAGAIATFTGRVRAKDSSDDTPTEQLTFETYEGVAEQRMTDISEDLEDRDGVYNVCLHHRTGIIENGEDIVFVVVLAGHREEAFRTVEDGINRLKDEVPIFKKEVTTDEEFWVHERS